MPPGVYERKSTADRFWEKVEIRGKNECWNWTACTIKNGYGHFGFRGKLYTAHRFSWILTNGQIPEGLCICHHCDNPGCVNPAHLFIGTQKDNIQDAINKNRMVGKKGEENNNSSLTEKQVLAIRAEYKLGNITQRELARKHGVGQRTITCIVNRITWKHI